MTTYNPCPRFRTGVYDVLKRYDGADPWRTSGWGITREVDARLLILSIRTENVPCHFQIRRDKEPVLEIYWNGKTFIKKGNPP